jgi:hypothetical protein
MTALAALQVDVTQHSSGLQWRDVVVPLATFIGGLLGVVIGARLSRATLFRVEKDRAAREQELESAREERELAAGRREARGVARALAVQFDTRRLMLTTSRDRREWWPTQLPMAVELRAEDQHLLATWMSDQSWETIALTIHVLFAEYARRSSVGIPPEPDPDSLQGSIDSVDRALGVLERELERLRSPTAGGHVRGHNLSESQST